MKTAVTHLRDAAQKELNFCLAFRGRFFTFVSAFRDEALAAFDAAEIKF